MTFFERDGGHVMIFYWQQRPLGMAERMRPAGTAMVHQQHYALTLRYGQMQRAGVATHNERGHLHLLAGRITRAASSI